MLPGSHLFVFSELTRLSYLFCFVFVLCLFLMIKDGKKHFGKIQSHSFKVIWIAIVITLFLLFWLFYPGFTVSDDAWATRSVLAGIPVTWLSLTYAYLLATGYLLLGKAGFVPLLSISIFSYLLLRVMSCISCARLETKWKWVCIVFLAVFSLNPFNQGFLLFHSRDIIFSLAVIFIGLLFFENNEWKKHEIMLLALLIVILGDLRAEGRIYLVIVPLLYFLSKKWNVWQTFIGYLSVGFFSLIYLISMPLYLNVEPLPINYKVTAWVMPLSRIYHEVGIQNIDPHTTARIDVVLNVEKLVKYDSPNDIEPFHQGAHNHGTTNEQWSEFQIAAFQLIAKHPEIYFKNRVELFAKMLNVDEVSFTFGDDLHKDEPLSAGMRAAFLLPETDFSFKGVAKDYYQFLMGWAHSKNLPVRLFNSLVIPLLFGFYCLFLWRKQPPLFCFAVLVMARVALVFFTSPGNYVRYIYVLLVFFLFGVPLWLKKSREDVA